MPAPKTKKKTEQESAPKKPLEPYVFKNIKVHEVNDETNQVNERTIIKLIGDDGVIIHCSVGCGYRLLRDLRDVLE